MIIDFYTRRELTMDVAFVRAGHMVAQLAAAHEINHAVTHEPLDEEPVQIEVSSDRLRRLAAHLRHLAADMQALQAGCLAAMSNPEWR